MAILDETLQTDVANCLADLIARSKRGLELCDLLEALADDLPYQQPALWGEARRQGRAVLTPHFTHLSQIVLPVLLDRSEGQEERQDILLRLQSDCLDGIELTRQLDDFFDDARVSARFEAAPEALGFGLRGFFEAFRRQLTWQLDVLWPLAQRVLTREDASKIMRAGAMSRS